MTALSLLKNLFGPAGYRRYAEALGRHPTTFHASVSDGTTVTSRLLGTSCALLQYARSAGLDPDDLLARACFSPLPDLPQALGIALRCTLGPEAIGLLAEHFGMFVRSVAHAVSSPGTRYEPHFRLIATTLLALRRVRRTQRVYLPLSPLARAA
jgi:hypothetical protein